MPARHVSTLNAPAQQSLEMPQKKRSGKRFFYDLFDRNEERLSERRSELTAAG